MVKFRTTIKLTGKTAAGIDVPIEVVQSLGTSKKPPVRVTINGHTYRTSIASMGGVFMMSCSAENRDAAGVKAGDEVDIDVQLDTEPREVTVPPDFLDALSSDESARNFFEGLSYSNKLRLVLAIEGAKTDETRQRRIAKTVSMLQEGKV